MPYLPPNTASPFYSSWSCAPINSSKCSRIETTPTPPMWAAASNGTDSTQTKNVEEPNGLYIRQLYNYDRVRLTWLNRAEVRGQLWLRSLSLLLFAFCPQRCDTSRYPSRSLAAYIVAMLLCKSCARGANQTLIKRGNPCLLILNCRLVSWVLGTAKVRHTPRCLTRMPDGTLGVAQGRIVNCGPLAPNKKRSLPQTASPRRVEMFSRKSIHLLEPPVWIMHFVSFCFIIRCGSHKRAIDRKQRAQPSGLAEDSEPVYTLVERLFPSWPPNRKALWLLAVTVHWPLKSRPSCEYITNDGSQPELTGNVNLDELFGRIKLDTCLHCCFPSPKYNSSKGWETDCG